MLNVERVDVMNESSQYSDVEIELTTEDADPALTFTLSENEAMKLAHMIMDQCSYAAKIKRGVCQKPKEYTFNKKRRV